MALLEVLSEEKALTILQEGGSLEDVRIRADRGLLRTALMNILHNAIKFSPQSGIIRIAYKRSEAHPQFLQLEVQDEGPGIAKGEHERVFERFFTSSAREVASRSGTGLDLSVSKLVIERIGGSISFDESADQGARCVIRLPEAHDGLGYNT